MERATHPGDVVTAKTRARLFSAIPQAHIGNRILLLDLHAEGIPHYFEGSITATHVYAKPVISKAVKQIIAQLGGDVVLASTDSGRAKWVESLANDLDLPAAFIMKRRIDGNTTKVLNVTADVKDKTVIIYDDMIRTAGSLIGAAQTYKKAGAKQIAAVATHGVFAGKGWQKMVDSGLFARVAVTDSHPSAVGLAHLPKEVIKVWSTAELFMPYLAESNEDD
jgi:ribose-phosphate pyrophosphokinase